MKDMIQEWLGGNRVEWIEKLTLLFGFSTMQAQCFVPALIENVVGAVSRGALDLPEGISVSSLVDRIDLSRIAAAACVDEETARSGLEAVLPDVASLIRARTGDLGEFV